MIYPSTYTYIVETDRSDSLLRRARKLRLEGRTGEAEELESRAVGPIFNDKALKDAFAKETPFLFKVIYGAAIFGGALILAFFTFMLYLPFFILFSYA